MLKRTALLISLVLFSCGLMAQNQGVAQAAQYQDIRDSVAAMITAVDHFCLSVAKINDATTAAAVINAFIDEYSVVLKNAAIVDARYPELNDAGNLPPAIQEIMKNTENLTEKLSGAFVQLQDYAQDPAVQTALQRLQTLGSQ